ncbi:hypothetical protein BJ508DRAFT_414671 [Ascobolus immersus RN42]|uniref:Beta/gamma crystallin 'Greek key' domain-containing protein n=1 Tax=Ascobolus immersus RN42 TaxID=1160509 RepID=A0A3N4I690_ASCIM|nr:hypothetical protein BJ508DRAFT_414671 [Ascobolus immersus RN42]
MKISLVFLAAAASLCSGAFIPTAASSYAKPDLVERQIPPPPSSTVPSGTHYVEVCLDANYQGECAKLSKPRDNDCLWVAYFNDKISSVRPLFSGAHCRFYVDANCAGNSFSRTYPDRAEDLSKQPDHLGKGYFNDKISSIRCNWV